MAVGKFDSFLYHRVAFLKSATQDAKAEGSIKRVLRVNEAPFRPPDVAAVLVVEKCSSPKSLDGMLIQSRIYPLN